MRLTLEIFHHMLMIAIEHDDDEPEQSESHDSTLDALIERGSPYPDPNAEMDHRSRMGFR